MLGMFLAWTGQTLNTSSKYLPCETMPGQTRLIFLPSFLLHLLFWLLTRLKAGIPALEGSLCVYFGVKLWEAYDIAELSRASDTSDTAVGIILTKQLINAHLEYLTFLPTARTYVFILPMIDAQGVNLMLQWLWSCIRGLLGAWQTRRSLLLIGWQQGTTT